MQPLLCVAMQPLLRLIARQYVGSASDADDVVQQGVVRFLQYGGKADDGRAYLATCVRNAALDFLKGKKKYTAVDLANSEVDAGSDWLECPLELQERRSAVESAVKELPLEQREVVTLKIWGEFTFAEIGEMTGVSLNTAASRFRYAMSTLQNKLREL